MSHITSHSASMSPSPVSLGGAGQEGNWVTLTNDSDRGGWDVTTADVWMSQLRRANERESVPADSSDLECIPFPGCCGFCRVRLAACLVFPKARSLVRLKNGREGSANAGLQIYQAILTSQVPISYSFFSKEMKAFPDHQAAWWIVRSRREINSESEREDVW